MPRQHICAQHEAGNIISDLGRRCQGLRGWRSCPLFQRSAATRRGASLKDRVGRIPSPSVQCCAHRRHAALGREALQRDYP